MKIVYCINGTYNSGGMERVLMTKANYLADVAGYEVIIVTSQQEGRPHFYPFSSRIKFYDLGIDYDKDVKYALLARIVRKWIKIRRHRGRLTGLLNTLKPDICISMFDYDYSFLYKIKDGSKKILEFHFCKRQKVIEASNLVMKMLQYIRVYVGWQSVVRRYDRFVVLTEEDKEAWGSLSNIEVIKNPIPEMPAGKAALQTKQVLSVGRISFQKGFDRLLRAWTLVTPHFPDWQLVIRGNGDAASLLQLAQELGVAGTVSIKPATAKISEEYLNSSVYVMSSRYEGFPMVLMEAMSYGVPVVSFACPCGPKELVGADYGTLVPNGDIEGLANGMMKWMKDEKLRRSGGEKARDFISQYVQDRVMSQWMNLFNSMMS